MTEQKIMFLRNSQLDINFHGQLPIPVFHGFLTSAFIVNFFCIIFCFLLKPGIITRGRAPPPFTMPPEYLFFSLLLMSHCLRICTYDGLSLRRGNHNHALVLKFLLFDEFRGFVIINYDYFRNYET